MQSSLLHASLLRTLIVACVALVAGFLLGRRSAGVLAVPHSTSSLFSTALEEPSVYNYISFDVKPERREDFLKSILANERDTLTLEPAARAYRWGEDLDVPNRFHFHEEYAGGKAGFQAHLDSAHIAQWDALVATDPFATVPNGPHLYKKMDKMRRGQVFF